MGARVSQGAWRVLAATALLVTWASMAACVAHPVGPARTFGKYRGKAVTTAKSARSAVQDGQVRVTAVLSGPGWLAPRFGGARLGEWLRRFAATSASRDEGVPGRIDFSTVTRVDDAVVVDAEKEDLASYSTERWFRDHVVGPLPGGDTGAAE